MDVRLCCHWVPIVILHWDRRNCWMGKGHLAQRIISLPPLKFLNTLSLLSHCSSLLCLFNTMFICCLYAPIQSSDCSEGYSCPSVCVSWKTSLFSPNIFNIFCFLKGVPCFQPSSQDFQGHNWDSGWRKRVFPQRMFQDVQGSGSRSATCKGTAFLHYLSQESQEMAFTHNHYNYLQARKAQQTWKWATKAARQFQHLKVFVKVYI